MERPNSIYVSYEVRKALVMLARAKSNEQERSTADDWADTVLRKWIQIEYPQLLEHQKKVEAMEKELLKTLK